MVEDNVAIASRNSYIDSTKEPKVFKVTAKYNYRPTQKDDLALQKVTKCPVLIIRLMFSFPTVILLFVFSKSME